MEDSRSWCEERAKNLGKAVKKNTSGKMVKKITPYDRAAVTDHAECFGVSPQFSDPK